MSMLGDNGRVVGNGAAIEQRSADLCVSVTAAVNTALTATLPAAGAGLFHYITRIEIVKFYAVLGVAAAAPVVVTTTNLPGSLAFTLDQSAATLGTASVRDMVPGCPLRSSAVNVDTTIVCPQQTQTIWRVNVWYYTAA